MKITETMHGDVSLLSLKGKLMGGPEVGDIHTAIKGNLDKNIKQIVFDLGGVDWMGSVGVGIIICCLTTVRNAGGDLKLANASDKVLKILEITKLEDVFDIHHNSSQAVASFKE
jgi:anti-sigma B factor antagonist